MQGLLSKPLARYPATTLKPCLPRAARSLKQQFRTPQRLDGMRGRGGNRRRFAAGQLDLDDPRAAGLHQVADFRMTCEEGLRVLFELAQSKSITRKSCFARVRRAPADCRQNRRRSRPPCHRIEPAAHSPAGVARPRRTVHRTTVPAAIPARIAGKSETRPVQCARPTPCPNRRRATSFASQNR